MQKRIQQIYINFTQAWISWDQEETGVQLMVRWNFYWHPMFSFPPLIAFFLCFNQPIPTWEKPTGIPTKSITTTTVSFWSSFLQWRFEKFNPGTGCLLRSTATLTLESLLTKTDAEYYYDDGNYYGDDYYYHGDDYYYHDDCKYLFGHEQFWTLDMREVLTRSISS